MCLRAAFLWTACCLLIGVVGMGCDNQRAEDESAPQEQAGEQAPREAARQASSIEQRLENTSLEAKVKIALSEERSLRKYDFEPEVRGGAVTLRGDVASAELRAQATNVVQKVEGVEEVNNQLLVGGQQVASAQDTKPKPPAEPQQEEQQAAQQDTPQVAEVQPPADQQQPSASAQPGQAQSGQQQQQQSSGQESQQQEEASTEEYYTVRSGDSLWEIANQHGLTVAELKRLNNMSSNSLHPGDRLRVK